MDADGEERAAGDAGIAFLITTIGRPQCAMRLISSIIAHHPAFKIYVVEQIEEPRELATFCLERSVNYLRVPFDAGLSVARNIGVGAIREPLFVLCDDDFVLHQRLPIESAARFMRSEPDLLILGGDLEEPHLPQWRQKSILVHRGRNLATDSVGRGLIIISSEFVGRQSLLDGSPLYFCDMVSNWGLCNTSLFHQHKIQWDKRFKIGGEHYDFFYQLKTHRPLLKVAYWPAFRCMHMPERSEDYAALRYRDDWIQVFAEKWDLAYLFNVGGALRRFDDWATARMPDNETEASVDAVLRLRTTVAKLRDVNEKLRSRVASLRHRAGKGADADGG